MKRAFCAAALAAVLASCASEGPIAPGRRDVPRDRGFSPSVGEELDAREAGTRLTSEEARRRVDAFGPEDEFDVSSDDTRRDWPIDTLSYKRLRNTAERSVYIRRALGRYAFIEAEERGLGVQLSRVRYVARVTSPTTAGEWWVGGVHRGDLLAGQSGRKVSLPDTIHSAVKNSYQIAAFGDLPAIRGTAIQEARGRFTPEFFADVSRERENEWASSPSLAAGSDRAITDEVEAEFGVRGRARTGGEFSVSQRLTSTDTNRTAYIPGEQSRSETVLTYIQPLLRGGGVTYNSAPQRIAANDAQIAQEEYLRQAEAHLLEVERAYWNLYVARAVYLQQRHLAGHGAQIAAQIGDRAGIDADPILLNRSRALATQWRADTVRAKSAMENAEFRLAALVNDKRFGPQGVELLPASAPNGALADLTVNDTITRILVQRPELQQAILQYEAALLREGMAANEALPELDLVLEARAQGGADGMDYGEAFSNQDDGEGSLIGLKFSIPLGFDERDARYKRRRIETVQQERQVLSAVATILLEVDVSANEYIVACNDLVAQRKALLAAQADTRAVQNRWDDGIGDNGIDLLSALLSSYQNLQNAEQAVATARATREVAAANLARARGVLLDRWGLKSELTTEIRNEPTFKLKRKK